MAHKQSVFYFIEQLLLIYVKLVEEIDPVLSQKVVQPYYTFGVESWLRCSSVKLPNAQLMNHFNTYVGLILSLMPV